MTGICTASLLGGCAGTAVSSKTGSGESGQPAAASSAPASESELSGRKICGSFIQPWLVENWTQERWDTEIQMMAEAGMQYIILQSVVDFTYDTEQDCGKDPAAYPLKSRLALYPSSLPELEGVNNGVDSLKECLEACKKYGLQAIIGPVSDNRWWLYGWGVPETPAGSTDIVNDSYMTVWTRENADVSNRIASEITALYGKDYGGQIYAWYYNNEVWNIDVACAGTDGGVYARILSNSLNLSLRHYSAITPGMPMLISSFCNPTMAGTAAQTGKMWEDIFALTEFREGDIFSPQDSFGNNTSMDLDEWTAAYKKAVDTKPGLILWSNNENFRQGGAVARVDEFIRRQVDVTAKYAEANICFSWNHYYSPLEKNPGYNAAYLDYVKNGKLDAEPPSKPVLTANGLTVSLNSEDNIGICGVRIYRNKETNLVESIQCRDSGGDGTRLTRLTLDFPGTYFISTYDFCGNESEKTEITVEE